jgi:hypothetical protein
LAPECIRSDFAPLRTCQNPFQCVIVRFATENIVTAEQFRRLALRFPEAYESAHMKHPDFRVRGGKLFATLAYPDAKWGMVKLTPEQQEGFVRAEPDVFVPVKGGWGRGGATSVKLRAATKKVLQRAMAAAWCNAAPKKLAREFEART